MLTPLFAFIAAALLLATPASAETWFLPDFFPNHRLAGTFKLGGVETIGGGAGRTVYWVPTLESTYWVTGNWSRTLTYSDEPPCCWDLNQWRTDGDRGRGGYFGTGNQDTYDIWSGQQVDPTFPLTVDDRDLPRQWIVPAGTSTAMRVHRPSDTLVGYLGRGWVCCSTDPVSIPGRPVLVRLSLDSGRLKLEGWGLGPGGNRIGSGEAFYFCRGCLYGLGGTPADGPVRWEVTDKDGNVTQQWDFKHWVPRTAQDEVNTTRLELDHLRRRVKELEGQLLTGAPPEGESDGHSALDAEAPSR